jgi:hypothetical protein
MPRAALSMRASRRSATHSMTDCQMASLVAKWRNNEPWVRFICFAMSAVVMSLGFFDAASAITASIVTVRRSSAGKRPDDTSTVAASRSSAGTAVVDAFMVSFRLDSN